MHERKPNRYAVLIERVFFEHYTPGATQVAFTRAALEAAALALDVKLPKNLGDVIYSFRYRNALPESVRAKAPAGLDWVITPQGRALYRFEARKVQIIAPSSVLAITRIPDATPGLVAENTLSDEQALLAVLRYNRLVDLSTGLVCYALQSHLRTTVPGMGQVETDDLYVGVDRRGVQYVLPVQAKGGRDRISIVQIEQDMALCASKFPRLVCIPIAAQFTVDGTVALFAFEAGDQGPSVTSERHYRLVAPGTLSPDELARDAARPEG